MTTAAPRREMLIEAAASLIADRGYNAVGIDDIGEAAGITGPGVYRHFPSKQALLEALCDRTISRMLPLAQAESEVEALVHLHVQLVVEERALIAVWVREQRELTDEARRSLRTKMRRYERVWREAVAPRRPELEDRRREFLVATALAALNASSLIVSDLPAQERAQVLTRMTLAALLSDAEDPSGSWRA